MIPLNKPTGESDNTRFGFYSVNNWILQDSLFMLESPRHYNPQIIYSNARIACVASNNVPM